ncbi:MAG: CoA transferase [Acetobacteraceae bacterium]
MNCGYDPNPSLEYDTPPIAPQVWHAYHIAGEQLAVGLLAALMHRNRTGEGQDVSCAVHEAVSKNTEVDLMSWVMRRAPLWRLTCRHAVERPGHTPNISATKDGRWYVSWGVGARDQANLVPFLTRWNMQADLQPPGADADLKARSVPGTIAANERSSHVQEVIARFIRAFRYEDMPWREAQDAGLLWAPLRKPHENALDEHWLRRGSFADVEHPELGRSFRYATSKWLSTETSCRWAAARRCCRSMRRRFWPSRGARRRFRRRPRRKVRCCPRAASRSRCRASASWISRGSSPRPGGTRFPGGAGGGEHQGRVEGQSGHPARGDGADRRAGGTRGCHGARCRA